MRFSERMGFKPASLSLQTDSMSAELRHSLWNVLHAYQINDNGKSDYVPYSDRLRDLSGGAQFRFFKLPLDDLEDYSHQFIERIKRWFLRADFHQAYDFVEWLAQYKYVNDSDAFTIGFRETINRVLQEERSAYRLVGGHLAPITNEAEIDEVNRAAEGKDAPKNVAAHIRAAIALFSDKTNPDYRNCVKEAISAVEASARALAGNEKATLGDALKELERLKKLHPALRDGFLKIYGYSNDADGIRHAMSDLPSLSESDARFMLVSCSAFANFLIEQIPEKGQ